MLDKLPEILIRECKLDLDRPVLIGVSGGPDSLVLLDALYRHGYQLIIAHLNHKLRSESGEEASRLARIAQQMGVPIIQTEADVYEYAKNQVISIEEAARMLRYNFLFHIAEEEKVQAVAVGHNADDQVETVLMHLLRGAGIAGLKGMTYRALPNAWSDEIPLIRPLLGIWRTEIIDYCHRQDLTPFFDLSNMDRTYFRNRLRHDLLPYLQIYNPRIKEIIYRTANILQEDYAIILTAIDQAWHECLFQEGAGYLALKVDRLRKLQLGMQRYIIRRAIAYHSPDLRDIDFDTVEQTIAFVVEPTRSYQRDLVSGLKLLLEANILWIAKRGASLPENSWPAVSKKKPMSFHPPGMIPLENGWELSADVFFETETLKERAINNDNLNEAWIDAHDLSATLHIRTRLPGDRFKPLGMDGNSIKLSDFMINVKMPSRAREKWPLVCSEETIIWIPGYRIHHAYRVTSKTKKILFLKLIHEDKQVVTN